MRGMCYHKFNAQTTDDTEIRGSRAPAQLFPSLVDDHIYVSCGNINHYVQQHRYAKFTIGADFDNVIHVVWVSNKEGMGIHRPNIEIQMRVSFKV